MIYLIFDTNVLLCNKYRDYSQFKFHPNYEDIRGKIERLELENEFQILIPEMSIGELFQKQLESFNEGLNRIKENYEACKQLYGLDLFINDNFDYRSILEARKEEYLSRYNINILPICGEKRFNSIVRRALNKIAPFSGLKGNSDKGFKDTVIWESILEFAEQNNGDFIFITHDKGFSEYLIEEFRDLTGQKIEIINKDEIRKVHEKIELFSNEQTILIKLQLMKQKMYDSGLYEGFVYFLKNEVFNSIEVNNLKCDVSELHLNEEIIDLNESDEDTYRFKIKGSIVVNILSPIIVFEMDILLSVFKDSLDVSYFEMESIEGWLSTSGEHLSLNVSSFKYEPPKSKHDIYMDETIEDIPIKTKVRKEKIELNKNLEEMEKEELHAKFSNESSITNDIFSQNYDSYYKVFLMNEIDCRKETIDSLIQVLNKNATVDWLEFESKISRMKTSIKIFLKRKGVPATTIDTITQQILELAKRDYEAFQVIDV
ncbi:MAG: PIN domain-containing protein [Paenibacillus dendritiformis]|uniref:PIN domain-containing protein n=1 Tax=uncultured Paenibacillus sp. TaxID=227322 RepID=UPI0025E07B00|nr:PIN domain-containing protein [uncultured Paenibacillus sp.]MDU5145175.1 PIN domain-containing protein [Paenibacillus dendritiformis]